EAIERGKRVLEQIAGQKPSQRKAKKAIRDFGIHEGEPIGVMVTVRGNETKALIEKLLAAREKKLQGSCFDARGSVSFGIKEHIEIPGVRYDPEIGILGLNVSILLERPGYSVARRSRRTSKVGKAHHVTKEDSMQYFKEKYGVTVI
ncbi:MAG: 50S ribosomal protein L5, partial [Thaumarchaeota archaeon]|nr:50S ribosomal protein L5 [Nitrososphaerota archaeon]